MIKSRATKREGKGMPQTTVKMSKISLKKENNTFIMLLVQCYQHLEEQVKVISHHSSQHLDVVVQ